MISNERQYTNTLRLLAEFTGHLEELRARYADNAILLDLSTGQFVRHIEEFEQDIAEYEAARAGDLAPVMPCYDSQSGRLEIGRALTRLRLAKGLTQEQVAKLVGTHQPSITRWENPDYEAYRLADLRKLANALGRDLDVVFVERAPPEPGSEAS